MHNMHPHRPPTLDMTLDGQFRPTPRPAFGLPWTTRLVIGSVLVAALAGAAAFAALALWLFLTLLPVAAGAAAVAYLMLRYRRWQARRGSVGGHGRASDMVRPL